MTKTLEIIQEDSEIKISDIDFEDEVTIKIKDMDDVKVTFWLKKENLISIKAHIDYLCGKM